MITFFSSLKASYKHLIYLALLISVEASSHRYFFALTEVNLNPQSQHLEIIHEITAHDIEYAIALAEQIDFSPEHPDYEIKLKKYVETHFSLLQKKSSIPLIWIGVEISKDRVTFYQESKKSYFLEGLVVKNSLLVDTYPAQINMVNYQQGQIKGSLTFTDNKRTHIIKFTDLHF